MGSLRLRYYNPVDSLPLLHALVFQEGADGSILFAAPDGSMSSGPVFQDVQFTKITLPTQTVSYCYGAVISDLVPGWYTVELRMTPSIDAAVCEVFEQFVPDDKSPVQVTATLTGRGYVTNFPGQSH